VTGLIKDNTITSDENILGVVDPGRRRWVLTNESLFDEREGKYGIVFDLMECSVALEGYVVRLVDETYDTEVRELIFEDGAGPVVLPATNHSASDRARSFFDRVIHAQVDRRRHEDL